MAQSVQDLKQAVAFLCTGSGQTDIIDQLDVPKWHNRVVEAESEGARIDVAYLIAAGRSRRALLGAACPVALAFVIGENKMQGFRFAMGRAELKRWILSLMTRVSARSLGIAEAQLAIDSVRVPLVQPLPNQRPSVPRRV